MRHKRSAFWHWSTIFQRHSNLLNVFYRSTASSFLSMYQIRVKHTGFFSTMALCTYCNRQTLCQFHKLNFINVWCGKLFVHQKLTLRSRKQKTSPLSIQYLHTVAAAVLTEKGQCHRRGFRSRCGTFSLQTCSIGKPHVHHKIWHKTARTRNATCLRMSISCRQRIAFRGNTVRRHAKRRKALRMGIVRCKGASLLCERHRCTAFGVQYWTILPSAFGGRNDALAWYCSPSNANLERKTLVTLLCNAKCVLQNALHFCIVS